MKRVVILGLFTVFVLPVHAKLIHRYDFSTDGMVDDVIGSADGALYGNAAVRGGALTTADAIGTAGSGIVANGAQLDARAVADLSGAFTIESWVSARLANDHRYATAWAFNDASKDNYMHVTPARADGGFPSSVSIKGAGGVAAEQVVPASFWDDGAIHQIVVTYDGVTVSYYIDGEFKSSVTDAGFNLSTLGVIGINGGSPYDDYSIAGSTYDFRIYDQVLTADQVAAVYVLGKDAPTESIVAATPEPISHTEMVSVRLSVKSKVTGDEDHYEDDSDIYRIKRVDTEMEVCTMMIGLKNGEDKDITCTLEWFFLSEDVVTDQTGIFDHGKKEVTVPARTGMKETAVSKAFVVTTVSEEWGEGRQYAWGCTSEGYIVLVTRDGQILAKDSNSARYLSDEWINKCRNAR